MSKTLKSFLYGTVLIALLIGSMACRTKKKPNTIPDNPPATATQAPPEVPVTVTTPPKSQTVDSPPDFVDNGTKIAEEVLPSDVTALNRMVQEKGYIQDAFYNYDEAGLSGDAQAALTASANWLKRNPQYSLLVEGHCDERGTEQYNLALGDRRANSAKDFLVTMGVDGGRIRTVSYGEERPFDEGHDDAAFAKNRRAHLVLVK
jgi:peptidoglycan-associated lipoprotein